MRKCAVNTKLESGGPAYKALLQKHSYTGDITLFGHKYEADYAPLMDKDGRVTGAILLVFRSR